MNPFFSPVRCVRFAACSLLALMLIQLGGCSIFRPRPPLELPAGFMARPEAAELANPQTREAAYKKQFPELANLRAAGAMVIGSSWQRAKDFINFSYFSRNDAGDAEHLLCLYGTREPAGRVFVIIVKGRQALVVSDMRHEVFEGTIRPGGALFGEAFGVEPWDLLPIFAIGQRIAAGNFDARPGRRTTMLFPRGEAGGLVSVELETRTGLPARATWELGGQTYGIDYRGWGFYTDPKSGAERLMPSGVSIGRRGGWIKLTPRAYQYDEPPVEAMFDPPIERGYRMRPLEELKESLLK